MKSVRFRWMSVALFLSAIVLVGCEGVGAGPEDYTTNGDDSLCSFHNCPPGYKIVHASGNTTCELNRTLTSCQTPLECIATDATSRCVDDVCVKSTECFNNTHCAAGELCLFWEDPEPACMGPEELDRVCGGDTLPGTCTAAPTGCGSEVPGAVLIGCDGMLYDSVCRAHLAGTSVSHLSVD